MKKICVSAIMISLMFFAAAQAQDAGRILASAGVKGGLIVHIGCGDGKLTAALRVNDSYLVHGLDTGAGNVAKARRHVQSLGMYGNVAIDRLAGSDLPYADNLVNLIVAEKLGSVPMSECIRVLAPNGVAYVKTSGEWEKTVKPWPANIDEWTHHLHDAGGNAVGSDQVVGPPRHLKWTAGPLWARSHGYTPSVSAMVSAGGRLFYICDETPSGMDDTVPSKWSLVARDAFSGVQLWKRPVPQWGSANFSGTPDTGKPVSVGRFTMPPHLGKRLVAVDDSVYVTLGATAPVTALDAASGEIKRVYSDTARADEILCVGGRLIVSINPPADLRTLLPGGSEAPLPPPGKKVCAIDIKTGRVLWNKGPFVGVRSGRSQDPFGRLELAADENQVFTLTQDSIESVEAGSGETIWKIDRPAIPDDAVRKLGFSGMFEYLLTVMVYRDGVLLLAQPEPNTHHTYHTMPGALYAFDARDGRRMWKQAYGGWGHLTQPDIFVVGDLVWTHVDAETEYGSVWGKGYKALDSSIVDYRIQALDIKTGEVRKEFPTKDIFNVGHHHRCYRNKSTERFLMSSRRGVEFVDLETGENYQNHWVRSGCKLGNLPCNGLLYVAPHPCGCYIDAKLIGFNALAASATGSDSAGKLVRGPAYGKVGGKKLTAAGGSDWPTYRGNSQRSGATESTVNADLEVAWQSNIGARPSGLVVSDGKVLVAGVDAHTVHALDADDGKNLWMYTTGARVDSPPTLHNGMAIFGSADGRVYCLRSSDGELAWRFDAAPQNRFITAFGQLESPWPVPGSVMMKDGRCWFAAGRSSYLDGGIRLYALDPATGRVHIQRTVYSPDSETGKMPFETSSNQMIGVLNDIPSTDGTNVYIRQMNVSSDDGSEGQHLFTTAGYLDSSWFNRTFWKAGRAQTTGLMVLGNDAAYGIEVYNARSRDIAITPGTESYRLKCISLTGVPQKGPSSKGAAKRGGKGSIWEKSLGIRVTAMVRAGGTIFVAGSPDIVDPTDPHGAWEGRKGGVLAAYAAENGKKLAEYTLPSPPVWDGMAAAGGRLYISLNDGTIICMRKRTTA